MDIEAIKEMKHAIGLDYKKPVRGKYKAWRNYCQYNASHEIWESLIEQGYATVYINKRDNWIPKETYWYSLTRVGLDLIEAMIGAKITEHN